jgi:hypothetical protein
VRGDFTYSILETGLGFESPSRSGLLLEHDLNANASRLSREKAGSTFPDHALNADKGDT